MKHRTAIIVVWIVGLALLAIANAQGAGYVRFTPSAEAFPLPRTTDEFVDEPDKVGVMLDHGSDGLQVVLVPAGEGSILDAMTGFAGVMPTDTLGRVDPMAALNLCAELQTTRTGVQLVHEDVGRGAVAAAYRQALEGLGFSLTSRSTAAGPAMTFTAPDERNVRLHVTDIGEGKVRVYLGT